MKYLLILEMLISTVALADPVMDCMNDGNNTPEWICFQRVVNEEQTQYYTGPMSVDHDCRVACERKNSYDFCQKKCEY